jgi:alpha-ketoglutarate-dependent taurine dioxygenase
MINITKLTGTIGATLTGINLASPSEMEIASLKQALDNHHVIFVEGQDLDRFQLSALGRHFGPPFLHPIVNNWIS